MKYKRRQRSVDKAKEFTSTEAAKEKLKEAAIIFSFLVYCSSAAFLEVLKEEERATKPQRTAE